ncbi:MAG: S8 family serine peptidase, partial [Thermoanaerobaculia bacterium]
VGDDGAGNQVGMAPGARWIGCRNMNAGAGTPTTYIECFQWFIAPTDLANQNPNPAMAPDVINNSWGCPTSEGCNPGNFAVMQAVVENVRTAGIFVAVSAGNDGSGCSTVNTPAAIYDAVFSVGSTTNTANDVMSSFSSRGPVTVDGSNRMKPDIAAPGSNVRSSVPGGGYSSFSGTSMAGPHVAGLVGLLVGAVPGAAGNIDLLEDVIRQSAVHPVAASQVCGGVDTNVFPNNSYGAGRIDALAAVNLLLSQADFQTTVTPPEQAVCAPASALYNVAVGQLGSFAEPVTLAASGNPAGSTVDFSTNPVTPPGGATMTVTTVGVAAGNSTITVTGTASPSGTVRSDSATLAVFTSGAAQPVPAAPANGALNVPVPAALSWGAAAQAGTYTVQIATDAGFTNIVEQASALASPAYSATSINTNTLYFWRVQASNDCGSSSFSTVFNFRTVAAPGDCTSGTTANPLYQYGFEAGAGSWTHGGTGDSWTLSTTNPHSGTALFHANDPAAVSDQRLVSPAVLLPAGQNPLVLKFWHLPNLENSGTTACYDGGILEVSTDAGASWTQVPNASLLVGPYTGLVSSSFSNPLAGLSAWCNATAYLQTIADVSAYAGQTAQFRLRLGSDTSASDAGWDVDDVVVQSCAPDWTNLFSDDFETGDTSQWSAEVP